MTGPPAKRRLSEYYRIWLLPFLVLGSMTVAFYLFSFVIDFAGSMTVRRLHEALFFPHPETARDTLGNVAQVITGILGIAITVISIIVQLAATRYSSRITGYFIKDPLNICVMSFFVFSGTYCMWVSLSFDPQFYPWFGTMVTMAFVSIDLLLLLPYFAYVFHFLNPENVVARLQHGAILTLSRLADGTSYSPSTIRQRQKEFIRDVEDIADIGVNSVQQQDKVIAVSAVNSLRDVVNGYMEIKQHLPEGWFDFTTVSLKDPDFLSFSPDVIEDIILQRTWVELKVFRQVQTIYLSSLNRMRDINYLIAIDSREIAVGALRMGDLEILKVVLKFINTFMRSTLNIRDIRTAYNLLYQYRLLAEGVMVRDRMDLVLQIGFYFKYYSQLANSMGISFIMETAAYDYCALCELALDLNADPEDRLLALFLELDQAPEKAEQETALRGVRKAQLKLATYYLQKDEVARARKIFEDMRGESPERMLSLMEELLSVPSKDFWEMIDRGSNLDYLPEERRMCLPIFYSWFPWFRVGAAVAHPVSRA